MGSCLLALLALAILGGCAKAYVTPIMKAGPLPKPDMIVVHDFAVSLAEVKLDQGIMKKALRNSSSRSVSEEEDVIGHAVADRLAKELVERLRNSGIPAARANQQISPTYNTLFLTGQFVTIDEGNQTERNWIGFGLGGTELRTRIQVIQGGVLVAEGETSTRSSLKPGMLVSGGLAAASQSVVPLVVGGTTTVLNETVRGTIEADAARTAEEVVKRVKKAYQERGWLP
jgi:hypothetical protein